MTRVAGSFRFQMANGPWPGATGLELRFDTSWRENINWFKLMKLYTNVAFVRAFNGYFLVGSVTPPVLFSVPLACLVYTGQDFHSHRKS